jgi:hypothetical protein
MVLGRESADNQAIYTLRLVAKQEWYNSAIGSIPLVFEDVLIMCGMTTKRG